MNLLTSVELHQCGQAEVIITIITQDVAFFLGEVLSTTASFVWFSCLAYTCSAFYCHLLCNNQAFYLLGAEVKHHATLTLVRVEEEATGIL